MGTVGNNCDSFRNNLEASRYEAIRSDQIILLIGQLMPSIFVHSKLIFVSHHEKTAFE
jgi:hypothetical protein